MIVNEASRMFSAISLGVFCRLAPSTRAIIRSMKLSPGFWVILHDDAVRQHGGAAGDRGAVAAGLPDDGRGLAGDRRLIHRGNAFHDVAVAGDRLAGLDDDDVALLQQRRGDLFLAAGCAGRPADEPPGHGGGLGPAQRFGLRLAAALGDGLGEVGENHRQPQPDHDQPARTRTDR